MKQFLKRFVISVLLAALTYIVMHVADHPKPEHTIQLVTAGVFLVCILYSLILE